ncbi:unnamed protein product [Linum tenue]|uniref:Uncharacterized protein n=1 Tax=Linum tenue TaxID=586396 RepID=A0AAV0IVC8_9ROSI|nr:unnamed protein product [Linum tenue]
MAQAWLHLWQRPRTAAVDCTATTEAETHNVAGVRTPCCCGCLAKLIRKLRKQGRMMIRAAAAGSSRQQTFQCRYDPLSYSLNFERSLLDDDEDYFQFCAFSSRFAAHPSSRSSVAAAT